MSLLDLLVELASTTPFQPKQNTLIKNQPKEIQNAFYQQNANFIKYQFMHDKNEILINERTVVQH